jgi:hypothetical protein
MENDFWRRGLINRPMQVGKFHSTSVLRGIKVNRSVTAAFRVYADDGGAVIWGTGSVPDIKGMQSRYMLTEDNTGGNIRAFGLMGQLKAYDAKWNGEQVGAVYGRLELVRSATTMTLGDYGISAGGAFTVATSGAITVGTNHVLAGVVALADFRATLTQTGKTAAFMAAKYDTTNWSDTTARTTWGYGLYVPYGAAAVGFQIGDFVSAAATGGLTLSSSNTAIGKMYADDGGVAMTGSLRGFLSRVLLTVDHPGDMSVRGVMGQMKLKDLVDLTNGFVSGVEGYLEMAGTNNIGATSHTAAVSAVVELTTASTITSGGRLAGVLSTWKSDATATGMSAAFLAQVHPNNTGKWGYGLYMAPNSANYAMYIGEWDGSVVANGWNLGQTGHGRTAFICSNDGGVDPTRTITAVHSRFAQTKDYADTFSTTALIGEYWNNGFNIIATSDNVNMSGVYGYLEVTAGGAAVIGAASGKLVYLAGVESWLELGADVGPLATAKICGLKLSNNFKSGFSIGTGHSYNIYTETVDSVGFEYFWGTNSVGNGLVTQASTPAIATTWALKIDVNGTPGYIPVYNDQSWES